MDIPFHGATLFKMSHEVVGNHVVNLFRGTRGYWHLSDGIGNGCKLKIFLRRLSIPSDHVPESVEFPVEQFI
jgi:hypothetical protein